MGSRGDAGASTLRSLPAVHELAAALDAPHALAVAAARCAIDEYRAAWLAGQPGTEDLVAQGARACWPQLERPSLQRVVNATGVILHTNLGRAPLATSAREAVARAAEGYSNLELDLETGARGSRHAHVEGLLRELTGAEAAIVVNNGAGAVLLAAAALAGPGRAIVVARGQLVEIGGGFRVPEVIVQSGARLIEVGTTNRTRLADYERALAGNEDVGAIMRVHQSNFRTVGFVEEVPVQALCELGVPVIDDVGSGWLASQPAWNIGDVVAAEEPAVADSVAAGAALVCCSGDKLLGGPQAGLMVGRRDAVAAARRHPLARALRIDKLSLAALEATLRLYRDPQRALREIPTLAMLAADEATLLARAERLVAGIGDGARVIRAVAKVGGGTLPLLELEGPAVALDGDPDALAASAAGERPAGDRADPRRTAAARPAHAHRGRRTACRKRRARGMKPLTLGTAGHIDHGKTALIRALTGVDTDRLPEERARGISIELGYASLTLPSGRRLSVVDVPGHERFVRTMVAGATGIDLFLMTIAADDGVMPQTREHAAVLEALGVGVGVVAVTKSDLADPDLALIEASELLPGAEAVAVSARTGEGLDELRAALDRAADAAAPRADGGAPARLHVDRVFTIRGAGTVVTGTLWSGSIGRGDELEVLPQAVRARVRGVQIHDQAVDRADSGQRVAVNLTGLATSDLARGDVLVGGDSELRPTFRIDAELEFAPDADPEAGDRVQIHHGTREAPARLAWLGGRFWQLRLEQPLVPAAGDRVVVRQIAPPDTIGGGRVLDPAPRRHGPSRETLARLERLARGEAPEPTGRALPAPGTPSEARPQETAFGFRAGTGAAAARRRRRAAARLRARRRRPGRAARRGPRGPGDQEPALPRRGAGRHPGAADRRRQAERWRGLARPAARRTRHLAQVRPGAARALRLREGHDPARRRARPAPQRGLERAAGGRGRGRVGRRLRGVVARQIVLDEHRRVGGALDHGQQRGHRGDLLDLLLEEPLHELF